MNIRELIDHIDAYQATYSPWMTRAEKIEKRYEDERAANDAEAKFNILWSNVQTLAPALYDKAPVPNIDRRTENNNDDAARTISSVLERADNYFIRQDAFNDVMRQVILDRLLGGRGVAWVRYVPSMSEPVQTTSDQPETPSGMESDAELPTVYSEDVVYDHVNLCDFGHSIARKWAEVTMVWRKSYLSRAELIKRFPQYGEHVPLDAKPLGAPNSSDQVGKKATIYEMWDKITKKVYWIHKEFPQILDEKDDPLRIKGFFPCPKPLYATLTNNSLIPTPDYVQYQDQAREIDRMTARITLLTDALRVAGVYDASAEGIQKLLSGKTENRLIPVSGWGMFAEKGGLKGSIEFLPIEQIGIVLQGLYASRDKAKQDVYELTGISDIIRGASNPRETLGAQELKGKYAGLRLGNMQQQVAAFARDLVEMTTEIIAEHFDLDTIKQISGVELLTEAQKKDIMMRSQMQQPPAPLDEKTEKLLRLPTWEQVEQAIRQDIPRCFIISVETDSTIKADQEEEKASRTEFLTAVSSFVQSASLVQDPDLKPLLMELLMFGVKGFRVGRDLENSFKYTLDKIYNAPDAEEKPDPAAEAARVELELKQRELELKNKEVELKGASLQQDAALKQQELQLKDKEIQADFAKHEMSVTADVAKTRIDAKTKVSDDVAMLDDDMNEGQPSQMVQLIVGALQAQSQQMTEGLQQVAMMNMQSNQAVIEAITKPKVTTIIRDPRTKELIGSEQRVE